MVRGRQWTQALALHVGKPHERRGAPTKRRVSPRCAAQWPLCTTWRRLSS